MFIKKILVATNFGIKNPSRFKLRYKRRKTSLKVEKSDTGADMEAIGLMIATE